MARATSFSKLLIQAQRAISGALLDVVFTVKGLSGQTADLVQVQDSTGAVISRVGPSASSFGAGLQLRMARAKYSFATDGGAVGLITPAVNATIPDNAIIFGGILNPTTALVGTSSTIAVGTSAGSSAAALKAATAEATYSADAVLATIPVFTAASSVKLTAAGQLTITVAVAPLTAGVLEITVFYFVAAA